ncbi:MAG: alpha/beta fold hydrolase [Pirellulaceae bacterium]
MNNSASWRSEYPFQSHYLELDSLRYHYLDEGTGPPLLWVHGNPTWSFYWRKLIQGLSTNHRNIAVDHIGCGLSDKPADYPYTLERHQQNLVQLVETLDLNNITLVVHDWGGAIGLGSLLQIPERFSRIVLFNTGAFPPPFVPWRIRFCRFPWLGSCAIRYFNLFARAALTMAVEQPKRMTPSVRAGFLAPYRTVADRVAIDGFVRDIPFTRRHPTWNVLANIEAGLPSLAELPIQIIWGMKDWCFDTRCLQRFQAVFPAAQVHPLDDAGHYVVEDAHEQILPLMQTFLQATSSPS